LVRCVGVKHGYALDIKISGLLFMRNRTHGQCRNNLLQLFQIAFKARQVGRTHWTMR